PVPEIFPPPPAPSSIGGLSSFPYFAFFEPGAPLVPISPFSTTLAIAGTLRAQCHFQGALKWCRNAFDPLQNSNIWAQCKKNTDTLASEEPPRQPRDVPCSPTGPVSSGFGRARAVMLEYVEIRSEEHTSELQSHL